MTAQTVDLTNIAADDGFSIVGDVAGDLAGFAVAGASDINGDGIDDFIVTALYNDSAGSNFGRAYVVFGTTNATRGTLDLTNFSAADGFAVDGSGDGAFGRSAAMLGDVNGDGINDFVVSTRNGGGGSGVNSGAAYVIFGKAGGTRANINLASLSADDGFVIVGDASNDSFGESVAGAGDVNGDGINDIIVGALGNDAGAPSAGAAYIIFGKAGATRATIDVTTLAVSDGFRLLGNLDDERAGTSVSGAGDVNGDGIDDFLIGASYSDDGGNLRGKVYVVFGKTGATRPEIDFATFAASDGFAIRGAASPNSVGHDVANIGDINGDGIDDFALSGYRYDSATGVTYVIYGKTGAMRANIELSALNPSDGFAIIGDITGDNFGAAISGAGDVNGDGIADLIVGARGGDNGGTNAGEAYVILGRAGATRGTIDVSTLAAADGFIIQGDSDNDQAGRAVAAAGDVNGDGIDDLLVGASFEDTGGFRAGAAYVIYGDRNFGAINGSAASETLTGTAAADRLNGFDGNDVLLGGAGADTMAGGGGNDIYVVDDAGDVVTELAGEGTDSVETGLASYTLGTAVENLEYTGVGAFAGTGNGLANIIVGGASGDTLSGGGGDDTLGGEAGNDILNGGEGSDRLSGGAGGDVMNGEGGNDRLTIDDGADLAFGGDGIDTVQFVTAGLSYTVANDVEIVSNQSGGNLTVALNALANTFGGSAGIDTVSAGDGQDSVYGRGGNDSLRGEGGNDYLFGDTGSDQLYGGDGADLLYGGADQDLLFGDAGNDTLYGEAGSDFLSGGAGADQLFGGADSDFFVFFTGDSGATLATADRIRDFSQAQGDRIQLDGIDAIAGGADDAFTYIGSAAFSNVAGQLRVEVVGGETRVSGDTDGDGVADFLIRIDGVHALTAADLVL